MEKKISMKTLQDMIVAQNEIVTTLAARVVELETIVAKNRGPKSEREMTEDDARRIILGDLKGLSHKAAAEKLGLSYGQIYSARGGYTFKKIMDEKLSTK